MTDNNHSLSIDSGRYETLVLFTHTRRLTPNIVNQHVVLLLLVGITHPIQYMRLGLKTPVEHIQTQRVPPTWKRPMRD